MIVFGGATPAINNNVWVLANADGTGGSPTWSLLSPSGTPPPPRSNHTAVYDVAANQMIVFGGGVPLQANDVWVLSDANGIGTPAWTELSPSGTPPPARLALTAVFDPASNRMTIFGGSGAGGNLNDVWVLALGPTQVSIDIKPGSDPNSINQGSGGVIPVAILGSETFDATAVDGSTCTLGDAAVKVVGKSNKLLCSIEDVNDDGFLDQVCKFMTVDLGAVGGDTEATIHCSVPEAIEGTDSIRIVPPE